MKKSLFIFLSFLMSLQAVMAADEAANADLTTSLKSHSSDPSAFSIIFALFFVICLIYITGLIYSKLNIIGAKSVKKQLKDYDLSHVVVLSTTQLGQNKNLHVVEVNKKKFLIGATPNSINLVKELDKIEDDEESFFKQTDSSEAVGSDFILADDETIEVIKESKNCKQDESGEDSEQEAEEFSLHKKYL